MMVESVLKARNLKVPEIGREQDLLQSRSIARRCLSWKGVAISRCLQSVLMCGILAQPGVKFCEFMVSETRRLIQQLLVLYRFLSISRLPSDVTDGAGCYAP